MKDDVYHDSLDYSLKEDGGPEMVEVKPRLKDDITALQVLMKSHKPPLRQVRSERLTQVLY